MGIKTLCPLAFRCLSAAEKAVPLAIAIGAREGDHKGRPYRPHYSPSGLGVWRGAPARGCHEGRPIRGSRRTFGWCASLT